MDLKLVFGAHFIKHHVLGKLAGVWKGQNVRERAQSKSAFVAFVAEVKESTASDPDVGAFSQELVFIVVNLCVPYLV
jgi:hypothetical protein